MVSEVPQIIIKVVRSDGIKGPRLVGETSLYNQTQARFYLFKYFVIGLNTPFHNSDSAPH